MSHWRLKLARRRLARRCTDAAYGELLRSPLPPPSLRFDEAELVCLDIETTGLDARNADMLSVGWAVIRRGRLVLATAESWLVRPPGEVGDSAAVHGLTDTTVESGRPVEEVLQHLLAAVSGRVLVVHYAGLDKALLDRLCQEHFGGPLAVPVADTLALERRARRRRHHLDEKQSLRLGDLRGVYRLPRYGQHDALADAIATGELLLAMVAWRGGPREVRLGDVLI